ncbi:MAG: hypothetical protein KF708_20420 [Pirellulales bacterium]|nr:hypothetical protein [Pirellulales bacterium]
MRRFADYLRRAVTLPVCLSILGGAPCLPGCSSAPRVESSERDPLGDWTKRARPESKHDHAVGISDKARETERRLGFR